MNNERDTIIQADEITNLKIDLETKSMEEIFDLTTQIVEPKLDDALISWRNI